MYNLSPNNPVKQLFTGAFRSYNGKQDQLHGGKVVETGSINFSSGQEKYKTSPDYYFILCKWFIG